MADCTLLARAGCERMSLSGRHMNRTELALLGSGFAAGVLSVIIFATLMGQLATDPDDDSLPIPPGIEPQTHKVMDNLARVLAGCGLTFADVVFVRIYLTDFKRDYAAMNAIYATYFNEKRRPG